MPRPFTADSEPLPRAVLALAAELAAAPALLALRSRRLVKDCMSARGVSLRYARQAVAHARRLTRGGASA